MSLLPSFSKSPRHPLQKNKNKNKTQTINNKLLTTPTPVQLSIP